MLQTNQILQGRYQLKKQLGNNAGRQTWLAADLKTSSAEPVTLKLLAFNPQMQWDEFKLFEREAAVLKQLNHPQIPKYRDYFSLDQQIGSGLCWFGLVQDYIPGYSLQQLLDAGKHFTETQVRFMATQVLKILIYLHGLNPPVLHRDIKPSNLILGKDKQVYLVDFGAVQNSAAVEGVTFTVVGTTGYTPLEQFWGQAVEASDLYALGATLIHLLTGISPADLPQRNLRIQFKDQVSINASFISWIEALTEPDISLRLSTASKALNTLQTGHSISYPLQTVSPPFGTQIQIKKSPTQLSIQIPAQGVLLPINLIKTFGRIILLGGLFISFAFLSLLILRHLLELTISIIMMFMFEGLFYSELVLSFILGILGLFFLFELFNLIKGQLKKIKVDINRFYFSSIGSFYIYFDKKSSFIRCKCSSFNFLYHYGGYSDILNIFYESNTRSIFMQTKTEKYYLKKTFTQVEGEWLVQEIQEWLTEG